MTGLLVLVSALASAGLVAMIRSYALHQNQLDIPNQRSSHTQPVPRGGGAAIVLVWGASVVVLHALSALDDAVLSLFWWAAPVAVIGWLDDRNHVAAKWRLSVQLLCAGGWLSANFEIVSLSSVGLFGTAADWVAVAWSCCLILAMVWHTNLYNFMDGIDGIATVEAIFFLVAIAAIGWYSGVMTVGSMTAMATALAPLVGALLGFLYWNRAPARIFMGDVGSGFLGFVLFGVLMTMAAQASLFLYIGLVLLAAFVVDATYTLLVRILTGQPFYSAHRSHGYQILARRWQSHRKVVGLMLLINLVWLVPIALITVHYSEFGPILVMLAWLPFVIICGVLRAGMKNE